MKIPKKILLFFILCLVVFVCILNLPLKSKAQRGLWGYAKDLTKDLPKKVLSWGADAGSGAPFVFRNSLHPTEMIGFDVDVINAIADTLGMKAEFIQNTWEGLVPGLLAHNYDVIVNGFEILPERKIFVSFSVPYYFTYEQIVVSKKNTDIHSLADLRGKTVGTLPSTLASRILNNMPSVKIKYYPEEINAFTDAASGQRLDAVLIDDPIARYYAIPNPQLKILDIPIGQISYGIAMRKDDVQLKNQINTAIEHLIDSGKLRKIIEKWGLWNAQTAKEWGQTEEPLSKPKAYLKYLQHAQLYESFKERLRQYFYFIPLLARGALVTIEISLSSMALAVILGLIVALMRLYATKFLSMFAIFYIEIIRGTPLLIQLYLIFYGLPLIGLKFSPFVAAMLGLGLNYAANEAENYRAGILSVPKHQLDAAFALGMSRFQALRYVIFPQAIRLVIPPITNDFIALIKDSSIVSVITLVELTTVYNQLATTYFDYLGIGLLVAMMYFLIGLPFSYLARYAEKRYLTFGRAALNKGR